VTIWQSQLAANDFPPICAMCGKPAETWRRFRFSTAPGWAYLLGAIMVYALSRRARGYLPMTRDCVRRLRIVTWGFFSLLPLAFVLWIAAAIVSPSGDDPTRSAITLVLVMLGVVALVVGLVGLAIGRRLYGPAGKVMEQQPGQYEPVIELQRVHPNFAMAVQQTQYARAAQHGQYPYQPR